MMSTAAGPGAQQAAPVDHADEGGAQPWPGPPPWEGSAIGLLEGLATTRAIRRFRPDPIPEEDIARLLWYASRAPSGSNIQPFRFLILDKTAESVPGRTFLARCFAERWAIQAPTYGYGSAPPGSRAARMGAAMERFVATIADAPLIVLVAAVNERGHTWLPTDGGSVYPAVQNLLLAARAMGYGGVVSQWHRYFDEDLHRVFEIPDEAFVFATVVLGRPEGHHGPVRRAPLDRLVYAGRWGRTPTWAIDPPGTRFTGGPKE